MNRSATLSSNNNQRSRIPFPSSKYTEINIKQEMPTTNEAMSYLKHLLDSLRRDGYKCVTVIHGYGSTGKGGAICAAARQWLRAQERNGKLRAVIFGEDFTIFDPKARELKYKCPETNKHLGTCNHGITVIEL